MAAPRLMIQLTDSNTNISTRIVEAYTESLEAVFEKNTAAGIRQHFPDGELISVAIYIRHRKVNHEAR